MWRIDRYACKLDIYTYIYIGVWIKTKTEEKIGRSLSMDLHAVLRMRGELNVTSVMTRGCHKTSSHAWLPLRIVPLSPFTSLLCPFVCPESNIILEFVFLSLIISFFFLLIRSLNSNSTRIFLWIRDVVIAGFTNHPPFSINRNIVIRIVHLIHRYRLFSLLNFFINDIDHFLIFIMKNWSNVRKKIHRNKLYRVI